MPRQAVISAVLKRRGPINVEIFACTDAKIGTAATTFSTIIPIEGIAGLICGAGPVFTAPCRPAFGRQDVAKSGNVENFACTGAKIGTAATTFSTILSIDAAAGRDFGRFEVARSDKR
jgi:hypothetical protein